MRWVLPGGAELDDAGRPDDEPVVACRLGDAVTSRVRRRGMTVPEQPEADLVAVVEPAREPPPLNVTTAPSEPASGMAVGPVPEPPPRKLTERLTTAKLLLEVLAVLVGLIGGILALLGISRK